MLCPRICAQQKQSPEIFYENDLELNCFTKCVSDHFFCKRLSLNFLSINNAHNLSMGASKKYAHTCVCVGAFHKKLDTKILMLPPPSPPDLCVHAGIYFISNLDLMLPKKGEKESDCKKMLGNLKKTHFFVKNIKSLHFLRVTDPLLPLSLSLFFVFMARAMWLNCRSCLQNFDNGKESQNTSVLLKQMPTTLLPLLDPVEVILEKYFRAKKYVIS